MPTWIIVAVVAILAVATVRGLRARRAAQGRLGEDPASRTRVRTGAHDSTVVVGDREPWRMHVFVGNDLAQGYTEVTLRGVPRGLDIQRGGLGGLQTGDPDFDNEISVAGDTRIALATLGRDARRQLLQWMGPALFCGVPTDIEVDRDGSVRAHATRTLAEDQVAALVDRLAEIAALLPPDDDTIAEALADNALRDPVPGFRMRCLQALVPLPDTSGRRKAAEAGLKAADPQSRLAAARILGRSDALLALVTDPHALPVARVEALRALLANVAPGERVAALRAGLRQDRTTGRAAIEALGQGEAVALAPDLGAAVRAGALIGYDALARDLARRLADDGDPRVEPPLIALLDHADAMTRLTAVRGLGVVGTRTAVSALGPLTQAGEANIRNSATAAIEAIRGRVPGAEQGALSLSADTVAGALSLSKEPLQGALSEAGRRDKEPEG